MKNLRKYIDDNRNLFDDKDPSAGHMERFEALLEKQTRTKKRSIRFNLFKSIAVAASILLLIGVGIHLYEPGKAIVVPQETNNPINSEFWATNEFYNEQMKEQIASIMCKLSNTENSDQTQLSTDIENIVKENSVFVAEMEKNENQEIAIRYLIKHYKANIQRLENINEKLGRFANC